MSTPPHEQPQYRYHIDAADIVVACDQVWFDFADANGAPELCRPPGVINRPLWEFISSLETVALYRMLLARVRAQGEPVAVSFRCDAPECRRSMRLELHPLPDNGVAFTSTLLAEEPRPAVRLLDARTPRSDVFIGVCSWCKRVRVEGVGWLEVEEAIEALGIFQDAALPQLTHTICESCYAAVIAALD